MKWMDLFAPAQWTFAFNSACYWEIEPWSVPVNVNVSKLTRIGPQLVSFGGGVRYWVDSPDGGASVSGLRPRCYSLGNHIKLMEICL